MKKRGLSEVVTSIIMILLILVAVGIVWASVYGILNKSSKDVTVTPLTNNVKIKSANIGLLTANVLVERATGTANITSLKFIFDDGTNTYIYEQKDNLPNELETKTYSIPLQNGIKPTTKITLIPIFDQQTGTASTLTSSTLSIDYSTDKNKGLVGYWKFEEDATDSSGSGNNGILYNNSQFAADPEFGTVINFSGLTTDQQFMGLPLNNSSLNSLTSSSFTFSVWARPYSTAPSVAPYNNHEAIICRPGFNTWINYQRNNFEADIWTKSPSLTDVPYSLISTKTYAPNQWHYTAITIDNNIKQFKLYVDNETPLQTNYTGTLRDYATTPYSIGACYISWSQGNWFNGTIDEVMIFNRSLSYAEIQQIYNSQK